MIFADILWNFSFHSLLRFIHICSVIVWSGTTIAGTWYVLCAKKYSKERGEDCSELELWVRSRFILLINVEHIAFLFLLASGIGQVLEMNLGFFEVSFIQWKFLIFLAILLPMEITDVVLTNFILSPALKRAEERPEKLKVAMMYHDRFYFSMTFVLVFVLPAMFYLAIFKPYFG